MSGINTTEASMMNATLGGTCSDYDAWSIGLGIGLCIVALVNIAGNLLTIAAFVTDLSLRQKPTNFFLLSLSCGDLLVGLSMPIRVSESICRVWLFGEGTCQFQTFYIDIGIVTGFLSMSTIALDRFLLISREYPQYLALQSRRNVLRTIAVVWTISIGIAFLEIIVWNTVEWGAETADEFDRECFSPPRNSPAFALTVFIITFLVPIVSIVGMSLRFLVLLRRRLKKYRSASAEGLGLRRSRAPAPGCAPTSQRNTPQKTASTEKTNIDSSGTKTRERNGSSESVGDGAVQASLGNRQDIAAAANYVRRGSSEGTNVHIGVKGDATVGSSVDKSVSDDTSGSKSQRDQMKNRYIRPAIIMTSLVTTFLICTLPYMIYISVVIRACPECDDEHVRFHLNNVLFLNSAINPFLYAATHPKIRDFHRRFFRAVLGWLRCSIDRPAPTRGQYV